MWTMKRPRASVRSPRRRGRVADGFYATLQGALRPVEQLWLLIERCVA
jgi:hypothetical protein